MSTLQRLSDGLCVAANIRMGALMPSRAGGGYLSGTPILSLILMERTL
jgi:hypothetical protein